VLLALIIILPFSTILIAIVDACKPGLLDMNLNIDENLGNYFEALEKDDKKWLILEEENIRRTYVIFNFTFNLFY
jgi:hypothetical protein